MKRIVQMDASNRVTIPSDLRKAAGISPGQRFKVRTAFGKIILEVKDSWAGKIKDYKGFKVWTGKVPLIPLAESIELLRHGKV
jgi:bifunctional DNA-binding transcriptional regulator/antitoxin component of YhaV-PrlF toxin-antitoxin module